MEITFEAAAAAHLAGDLETAERGYLGFPTSRNALYNLGRLYRETGRLAEAERVFGLILSQLPDFALARRGLAMTLLAQRRYAEAWPHYEARREVQRAVAPTATFPEWRGESLDGKTIVVLAEQGFGDQIMFARYLPSLAALGARVVVGCNSAEIGRLFERAGYATVPYLSPGQPLQGGDYWVYICSLPLRLDLGGPPAPLNIEANPRGVGIGVAPRGNPRNENDHNRSMSSEGEAALLALGQDLRPEATGARDFLETAEAMEKLDLVITVDSSAAHLACALGKPCWVLLPRIGLDWRWNDGVRSDWYPRTRLFRQEAPGDWGGALAAVRAALAAG